MACKVDKLLESLRRVNESILAKRADGRRRSAEASSRRIRERGMYFTKSYFVSALGHLVRSHWEEIVCLMLKNHGIDYAYERPYVVFDSQEKKHVYYVDITIGNIVLEVKGYTFGRKPWKIDAFASAYPDKTIYVVTKNDRRSIPLRKAINAKVITFEDLEDMLRSKVFAQ